MAELQIFKNDEFGEVRTTTIDHKPYFCGSDVAKALGYANPQKAIRSHCELEGVNELVYPTDGGYQVMKFITLPNVIRLIVAASKQSNNPNIKDKAKKYEKWIFEEIMPSIHANGYYIMPNVRIPDFREIPIGELGSYLRVVLKEMKDAKKSPKERLEVIKRTSEQFGVILPDNFTDVKYEQLSLL